ncbi:MAG: diacylglycerol kinase family lipid kinase [Alphaproteobacteria bacterium]|nr:diacylglycerol kinase family lipid kinase [Alphaproteobacteria bacterium]
MPAQPRRILVVRNPVAGQRRAADYARAIRVFEEAGCSVSVAETTARGDAVRIAREADTQAFDVVVAAGGDGTINEVVNGLVGGALPLGLIPLGTANVLAHEVGIGPDARRAAGVILTGRRQPIALANAGGHYCCLMASAGYDARAITRVRPVLKRLTGEGAYYVAGFEEMLAGTRRLLQVEIDGVAYEAASVVVANGRLYGGRYLIAPDADIREPVLHTILLQRPGRWNITRYGIAVMRERLHLLPDVEIVKGTTVRLAAPAGEPWQSDGDLIGEFPVDITVEASAIELMVPGED